MLLCAHAGAWTSKQIKASHRLEDLQSRQVNIVHVLRPEATVQGVPAGQLLVKQQSRQVGASVGWVAGRDPMMAGVCGNAMMCQHACMQ
jgi:diaminopimelate epimerase